MKDMTKLEKTLTVGLVGVTGLCVGLGVQAIKHIKKDETFLNELKEKTGKIRLMVNKTKEDVK